MGLLSSLSSKLQKLTITAIGENAALGETFEVMFNPETYSLTYQNKFAAPQGINTSGKQQIYSYSLPAHLALTLIFDNSRGPHLGGLNSIVGGLKPISQQIQTFYRITTKMDGHKHSPHELKIEWGSLHFEGYLEQLTIHYTLFDRAGIPLRAELKTQFVASADKKKLAMLENKSSPDLTKIVTVNEGDKLPQLAKQEYGDPSHYIAIAQANHLNHFRSLVAGRRLVFPPIDPKTQGET